MYPIAQIFTHQQVKEDQIVLYGFGSAAERDLFRQLTSVSGVGAQLAIALLDTLGLQDLVQAIVGGNTRILDRRTSRPGTKKQTLGMATASRFDNCSRRRSPPSYSRRSRDDPAGDGITGAEVLQALQTLSQDSTLSAKGDADDWIREAIAYLSR